MQPVTTTCLLTNYNYGQFVGESVEGALRQTTPFDEIIIVDDGSTDGSADLLKHRYGGNPRIQIINKHHGGQLSCFNEGASRCT
jgi:glycosyltransferase involved in cell wall biosynthesis